MTSYLWLIFTLSYDTMTVVIIRFMILIARGLINGPDITAPVNYFISEKQVWVLGLGQVLGQEVFWVTRENTLINKINLLNDIEIAHMLPSLKLIFRGSSISSSF